MKYPFMQTFQYIEFSKKGAMQLQQNCSTGKRKRRLPDQRYIQAQCRHRWKRAGLWKKMCSAKHLQVWEPTSKTVSKNIEECGIVIRHLSIFFNHKYPWMVDTHPLFTAVAAPSTLNCWKLAMCLQFWNMYSIQFGNV